MSIYDKLPSSTVITYGEENGVASFYKWFKDRFDHPTGYPIFFDKDNQQFSARKLAVFPSIVINQMDMIDDLSPFIGNRHNMVNLLFYVYFNHHMEKGGTRRLLRRGRDQIAHMLRMAGVTNSSNTLVVPPIQMYDFSTTPATSLSSCISVDKGMQQRFIQDEEFLSYEFIIRLKYPAILF